MLAIGMLARVMYDFRDRLTKAPLPPHIRFMPLWGGILVFMGFNGGTALTLMTGLGVCIACEIILIKKQT